MQIVSMSNEHSQGVISVFNDAILNGCTAFPKNRYHSLPLI